MVEDEDIERLLKSLPNWIKLMKWKPVRMDSVDDSPEDARSDNLKETDLFVGLFGGKSVSQSDIMTDLRLLEQLAHFHESMVRVTCEFPYIHFKCLDNIGLTGLNHEFQEWMSEIISSVASLFSSQSENESELREPLEKIRSLAYLYQELGSTALLLLYLEV